MYEYKKCAKYTDLLQYRILWRFHIQYCESFFNIKYSSAEWKECVFKYLLNATLNCAFLFLRHLRLENFWKFWCQHRMNFSETLEAVIWSMKIVLLPSINTVYRWICLHIFLVVYTEVHIGMGQVTSLIYSVNFYMKF